MKLSIRRYRLVETTRDQIGGLLADAIAMVVLGSHLRPRAEATLTAVSSRGCVAYRAHYRHRLDRVVLLDRGGNQ